MRVRSVITRIKAVHWVWWALWLGGMALLGLLLLNYPRGIVSELWEDLGNRMLLWPFPVVFLGRVPEVAGGVALVSLTLVIATLERPARAPISMGAAVGVLLIFFAFYACAFLMFTALMLRQELRRASHATGQAVPEKTTPGDR